MARGGPAAAYDYGAPLGSASVVYTYDEGGALQTVEVKHRGSFTAQTVVGEITYNARGQRESVVYGSTSSPTTTTSYTYDPQTYRLASLSTIRGSDDANLQGLHSSSVLC